MKFNKCANCGSEEIELEKRDGLYTFRCEKCGLEAESGKSLIDAIVNWNMAKSPEDRISEARDYLVAVRDDDDVAEIVNSPLEILGFDTEVNSV